MEAISHAGTSIGILAQDGILLAAEKKITSKLLDPRQAQEKIFTISEYHQFCSNFINYSDIICVVAGITSDANILIDYARLTCQRYQYSYNEPIPVEQLVQTLCNLKQSYTQHGGMRPFGTSFLIAGWDKVYGFQIYQSDPSGNYGGWKATCIGANSSTAQSIFKTDYPDEDLPIGEAKKLLLKVLTKTSETTTLSGEKRIREFSSYFETYSLVEIAIIQRGDGKTSQIVHTGTQADGFIKAVQSTMETTTTTSS